MVKLCQEAPNINHLFFVNDSLIVMKANVENATKLNKSLHFMNLSLDRG
jgi:hypothetical protein